MHDLNEHVADDMDLPWSPEPGSDARYALFPKDRRVVVDDGTPIAYTIRNANGPAHPVLFANGWSCSDAYWALMEPLLEAAGHPCIIPDTRGHGASGLPRRPGRGAQNLALEDLSMERVAGDLVAVLDDSGFEQAIVVGHSMGVQSALEVYRRIPDRTLGLVLIAGTYENPAKTFYGMSLGDKGFPVLAAAMRWLPEIVKPVQATIGPASVGHFGARLARAAGPKASAADLHPYLLHVKQADIAVLVKMAAAMRGHSAADLLPEIGCPTLVVAAGHDVFTPARCAETMHHRIPDSELITFSTAGHTLPIEEPDAIVEVIDHFIERRLPEPKPRRKPARRSATTRKPSTTGGRGSTGARKG